MVGIGSRRRAEDGVLPAASACSGNNTERRDAASEKWAYGDCGSLEAAVLLRRAHRNRRRDKAVGMLHCKGYVSVRSRVRELSSFASKLRMNSQGRRSFSRRHVHKVSEGSHFRATPGTSSGIGKL